MTRKLHDWKCTLGKKIGVVFTHLPSVRSSLRRSTLHDGLMREMPSAFQTMNMIIGIRLHSTPHPAYHTQTSYTSSSSSTMGRDDWWTVGELLEVKASTHDSRSRGDSLRKVRHIGVSNPRCRTMNPDCLPPGSLSTHVFLKLRTPKGLHTFFCGYSTAKCSSDVLYTLT